MFPMNPKMVALLLISIPCASVQGGNPFREAERWSENTHRQVVSYVRYVQDQMRPIPGYGVIQQDALNILHGAAQVEQTFLHSPGTPHTARGLRFPVRDLNRMIENAQRNIRRMEADIRHHTAMDTLPPRADFRLDRGITFHVDRYGVHPVPIHIHHGMDQRGQAQLRVLKAKLSSIQKALEHLDQALWAM